MSGIVVPLNPVNAIVVPEGEHIHRTADGEKPLRRYTRQVSDGCRCGTTIALRVCADEPLTSKRHDHMLDAYLGNLGWEADSFDNKCPDCVRAVQV